MHVIHRKRTELDRATIGAGYAKALFDFTIAQGVEGHALVAQSGIDMAQLKDPDSRLAFSRYIALLRSAKELSGDPALALRFGANTRITDLSIVGLIGATSDTLADAFVQMNRYARLTLNLARQEERMRLVESGSDAWIVIDFPEPALYPEVLESGFARMVSHNSNAGPNPFVKAVHFTYSPPLHREAYNEIFNAEVVFDSDRNAILTDAAWMAQPGPMKSQYVFAMLRERGDLLLKELEQAQTLRAKIERIVLSRLHEGAPKMSTVATKLGISRSTLFRHLRDEGIAFETLIDDLRRRAAEEYLMGGRVTVNDIAYLTGFSEAAAFSRAFRRWTGVSPNQFKIGRRPE